MLKINVKRAPDISIFFYCRRLHVFLWTGKNLLQISISSACKIIVLKSYGQTTTHPIYVWRIEFLGHLLKTCTSARGDFTCLEVQFILSRMGTGLPEEIADLVKYDETTEPNGWYVPEPFDATLCWCWFNTDRNVTSLHFKDALFGAIFPLSIEIWL